MPLPRLCWFVFSFLACHANVFSRLLVLVLLLIECVHPNSGPPSRRPPPPKRLTSWNCNGIGNSAAELNCYLNNQNVLVACIQETKLSPNSRLPSFPGYAVIRKDGVGGGGGLFTLVHHSVQFSELASPINDNVTEIIVVQLSVADSVLKVVKVYIPLVSSCPPGFCASLSPLLVADTIVLGDVNGHDEEWSLRASDARGDHLADAFFKFLSRCGIRSHSPRAFFRLVGFHNAQLGPSPSLSQLLQRLYFGWRGKNVRQSSESEMGRFPKRI